MKKGIYLTIITIITIICIIVGALHHMGGFFGNIFSINVDKSPVNVSKDLEAFDSIHIDTNVMDIKIIKGDSYHLSYECAKYLEPEFKVENNTFTLTQTQEFSGVFNFNTRTCTLTLTVPSDIDFEDTTITSDVGDISLTGFKTSNLYIEADVGDISAKDAVFKNGEIYADVGDTELDDITFTSLELTNDVGDVELISNSNLSDYEIELSCDIGEVNFRDKNHGDDYSQNGSDGTLTIDCSIGDIEVTD